VSHLIPNGKNVTHGKKLFKYFFMSLVIRLVFEVLSNVLFIPALYPLAKYRRHFALFVGLTQLLAAFMYCLGDFLDTRIFLEEEDWHFISDVLSLTYACLIIIHLSAFEDEETNMVLRYVAFFCSWIFKYRDEWDSIMYEALLVVGFIGILIFSHISNPERRKKFSHEHLQRSIIFTLAGLVFFIAETQLFADTTKILMGFAHASAGAACYNVWSLVTSLPHVKKSDIPSLRNNGETYV
jgi:hypothetical protein